MKNNILKVGSYVQIVDMKGIQCNERKARYFNGNLVGKVKAIYQNYIYKVQIDPLNYVFLTEKYLEPVNASFFKPRYKKRALTSWKGKNNVSITNKKEMV